MHTADDKLRPFIFASAGLHGFLFVAVVFGPAFFPARNTTPWGNSNDRGIKVGVASSLPGIPLPSPPVVTENAPSTSSKTLNPAEIAPKAKEAPTPADIKIPTGKTKPDKTSPKVVANATPPKESTAPSNAIPGQGGQSPLPFGGTGGGSGQASFGDGAFGSRFPEYVTNMTRAIQAVWQDSIVGIPRGSSPRVYVTFTIGKKGEVSDLEVSQGSGSAQLDNSAKRAVLTAKIPALPREYSGSSVDVRFYFEYTR